ncbi:MAG TPA: hypothetical protein P5566_08850 [Spirochaetota bacterium]|nr:hypothetical protein [Spirochaetota bacterium]
MITINELQEKILHISETWNGAYINLKHIGLNESNIVFTAFSLSDINKKFIINTEIIISIEIDETVISTIALDWLTKINQLIDTINNSIIEIQTIITNIESNTGFKSFNDSDFQITCNNDTLINISPPFSNIITSFNEIRSPLFHILSFSKYKHSNDLIDSIQKYQNSILLLKSLSSDIENIKTTSTDNSNIINSHKISIESYITEITKIRDDFLNEYQSIKEKSTETDVKVAQIKEISNTSQTLETTINTYKSKFDTYTTQIDERLKKWDEIHSLLESSNKKNELREKEIEELTKTSNDLIKGATVIGLASSFKKQHDNYKWELRFARWSFYFSILLLFISVMPLILYILPREISQNLPALFHLPDTFVKLLHVDNPRNDINTFGIMVRFLILIPPTWLTKFNSRRYRELFILREEYAHKSTIAQSIYGFKKESPKYEDEITAGVFLELNRKPNITHEKISTKDVNYENPIIEILRNLLSKALDVVSGKTPKNQ